ncbi:hypothetical protein [Rubritalea tangerina]
MKSCLFILIAVFILAGLGLSLGTIFFVSADTKVLEEPTTSEQNAE